MLVRFVWCWVLLFGVGGVKASELEDFESSATSDSGYSDTTSGSSSGCSSSDDEGNESLGCSLLRTVVSVMVDAVAIGVAVGVETSRSRVTAGDESSVHILPRSSGDALLPERRFDLAYQRVSADIASWDGRVEVGQGPWAVQSRFTHLLDQQASESLSFFQAHGVLRLSYGNHFSFNPGFGLANLSGQGSHWGGSLALPVYWHFHPNIGLELINAYGFGDVLVDDKDVGVLLSQGNVSVKLGQRRLVSPNKILSGYYVGVSYRY